MFRQLAGWFGEVERARIAAAGGTPDPAVVARVGTEAVWSLHPEQLLRFLEEAWTFGGGGTGRRPDLPVPVGLRSGLVPGLESGVADLLTGVAGTFYGPVGPRPAGPFLAGAGAVADHLIYAYLVENTKIVEIVRAVLTAYRCGERLEVPSQVGHRWLRATEALFFRPLPSGSIAALTSEIRPDAGAIRRNAYHRMFGMDLNHGRPDGSPYPYPRAVAANTAFVGLFEDLLREVWIASENFRNTSGTNPTDEAAIAAHARDLEDMLTSRRQNGSLAREEFVAVATLSWFHLALETENAVVADLKASGGSPEERLRKIGERVEVAPHARSENFLALSTKVSPLLLQIEQGQYSSPGAVSALYTNPLGAPPNPLRRDVLDIINQWSTATGKDLKTRRAVTVLGTSGSRAIAGAGTR